MNKFLTGAVVLVAATASSTFAYAAEEEGNIYMSLTAGLGTLSDTSFNVTDPTTTPNQSLNTTLQAKSAAAFGLQSGYRFGNWRVGTELTYQKNDIKGIRFDSLNGTAITSAQVTTVAAELFDPGTYTVSGTTVSATSGSIADIQQLGILANVSYDLLTGPFKPYIGAGIGLGQVAASTGGFSSSAFRFAWQLRGGASYQISSSIAVFAEYTYRQVGGGHLSSDDGLSYNLGKAKSSFFTGGLRYTFGGF